MEGHEEAAEALGYAARPMLIKAAMHRGFVKATANGYFVTTHACMHAQEAGQGNSKADEAEAGWVEREAGNSGDGKGENRDRKIGDR